MSLVRENATALYQQIADRLRREIADGRFEPSGRLPSEAEIGARFDVSRVTVRLALEELDRDGLIDRKKGKGTFVAGKQVRHELNVLRSFHETLRRQGLNATMRVTALRVVATPAGLRPLFGSARRECLLLQRLHLIDGEPIALGRSYLRTDKSDLKRADIERTPTYSVVAAIAGTPVIQARMELGAQIAGEELAKALNTEAGAALLTMERTSYFRDGACAEHSTFFIRPERYKFVLNGIFSETA
ncbi:GntR family transcriptional regulator [Bradyrhizobium sp. SSUT18]|uniref:GntR family transcriptional regulator n=1 Tax=Bradyrhizobium sp. SSUT18 TaxID=3040602 RepID=UPI00244AB0D7|nr:GntR family transcriptional regulator [Bradyrhizobium sp. SSUT18]MDH2399894.1 GntR family transcriptional regulator [Bradyrhizobium sp. SSUT18]